MIRTYKCRCCKNCRWVDVYNDSDRTRVCRYYGNAVKTVDDDETCAGWEPCDGAMREDFVEPRVDSAVKEYEMTVKAVVKGPEHKMRYAAAVGEMLNSLFSEIVDDAMEHDGYEIFLLKASEVMVSDREDGGDA